MVNVVNDPRLSRTESQITGEACAWIAQLETGGLTRQDIESFQEWVQRSPRHATEIRRLARLSADINSLTGLMGSVEGASVRYHPILQNKRVRRRFAAWSAAITIVVLLPVSFFLTTRVTDNGPAPEWHGTMTTAVGDYREVQLPDGSAVVLNTDTHLEAEFGAERRVVRFVRGEALFTVAHDPDRPFVVQAGDTRIQAIGTAFVVRFDDTTFEVSVTEGSVSLGAASPPETTAAARPASDPDGQDGGRMAETAARSPPRAGPGDLATDSTDSPSLVLSSGQSWTSPGATAGGDVISPIVKNVDQRELRRRLAWRDGLLEFDETPLAEVVREVSRHTTTRIEIADPSLRDLQFGGLFRVGDTGPLFTALNTNYGIRVEYVDDKTIRLTSSETP